MEKHFHSCPECYQHVACVMGCSICTDLCEGWDEASQEFTGRLFGSPTECAECKPKPSHGWTTARPTSGKWWVAIHPVQRGIVYDEGVYPVLVKPDGLWQDGRLARIPPERLIGACYLPRETPQDPFAVGEG